MKSRKPWLAATLSFLCPGVGQLYNGNLRLALWSIPLTVGLSFAGTIWLSNTFAQLLVALFLGFVVDLAFAAQAYGEARASALAPAPLKRFQRWWVYPLFAVVLYGLPDGYGTLIPERMLSFQIPSESMVPNLLIGDRLVADGWAFWGKDPKRGDIVTFQYPRDHSLIYVKRLVGLPGDRVELKNGVVWINGQPQAQKAFGETTNEVGFTFQKYHEDLGGKNHVLQRAVDSSYLDFGPVEVPADQFFMMGDNRDRSSDSRVWGFVKREELLGRMQFIYFSWDSGQHRMRWDRVGLAVN